MRADHWNDGVLKALLILFLVLANILLSSLNPWAGRQPVQSERGPRSNAPPAQTYVARP